MSDRFFRKIHARILISQLAEDGFNAQKNVKRTVNRRGTPKAAYNALRRQQVLSTRHDFEEVKLAKNYTPDDAAIVSC